MVDVSKFFQMKTKKVIQASPCPSFTCGKDFCRC